MPGQNTPQTPVTLPSQMASDYLDFAEQFYETFREARDRRPISWPRYFLLCHATELALKAYLLWNQVSEADLRRTEFRHNIAALLIKAVSMGLALSEKAKTELVEMSEPHAEFRPRYPILTGKSVVVIDYFVPYFLELLRAVRVTCRTEDANRFVRLESDEIEIAKIRANGIRD